MSKDTEKVNQLELQKKELEVKHGEGKIIRVTLKSDKQEIDVLVLKPGRRTMGKYLTWQEKDSERAHKLIVGDCLLTSLEIVDTDDELYTGCALALVSLLPIGSFEIKN